MWHFWVHCGVTNANTKSLDTISTPPRHHHHHHHFFFFVIVFSFVPFSGEEGGEGVCVLMPPLGFSQEEIISSKYALLDPPPKKTPHNKIYMW